MTTDPHIIFRQPSPAWILDEPTPAWVFIGANMRRSALTKDFVAVTVHSLRTRGNAPVELGEQAVAIAVVPSGDQPVELDWVEAEWVGDAGSTRDARAMFGPGTGYQLTAGAFKVFARVTSDDYVIAESAYNLDVT